LRRAQREGEGSHSPIVDSYLGGKGSNKGDWYASLGGGLACISRDIAALNMVCTTATGRVVHH